MNSDLQKLIDLQEVDARIAALRAEVAALPKKVQQIEAKLAGSKGRVEAAQAGMKADGLLWRNLSVSAPAASVAISILPMRTLFNPVFCPNAVSPLAFDDFRT